MELLNLSADFQPDKPIENYESLIWTERYSQYGDFQLQGYNISELLTLMPRERPVAIRESNAIMMVEDHKISFDEQHIPRVTIVGRTYETVLERRWSVNTPLPLTSTKIPWTVAAEKESDVAYKIMRVVIGDVERLPSLPALSPAADPNDAIPEIVTPLPLDYSTATPNTYEIKSQNLYMTMMELVNANHRGLRAVRPDSLGNKVRIEIYNGADLTNEVIFDARLDQFDESEYLLSNRGSANVAYVFGIGGGEKVLKTSGPEPSGLDRRILGVDDGDDKLTTAEIRKNRGLVELYKYNATAVFGGQVSDQVAAGFNQSYFLGDIVKFNGDYGIDEKARVAEFVRSFDSTGEKAYPTFETVVE